MIKKEGTTYQSVAELLRSRGMDPEGLEVATLSRGPDHLVILDGETVGEYNHRSKCLVLYSEREKAPE